GPDPNRGTMNGGDEDLAEPADGAQEPRDHVVRLNDRRRIQEVLEVIAACEARALATQQDHAQLLVRLSLGEGLNHRFIHVRVECVSLFRTIQTHFAYMVPPRDHYLPRGTHGNRTACRRS